MGHRPRPCSPHPAPPHSPGGAEGGRGSHRGPLSRQEMWGPRCGRVLRGHEGREKPRFPAASLWDSLRVGEQAEGFLGKAPRPFLVGAFPAGSFGGPGQCLPRDQAPTGHPHGEGSPGFLSPPRAAVCQPPKFRRERTRPEPAGPLRRRLQGPTRPQGGRGAGSSLGAQRVFKTPLPQQPRDLESSWFSEWVSAKPGQQEDPPPARTWGTRSGCFRRAACWTRPGPPCPRNPPCPAPPPPPTEDHRWGCPGQDAREPLVSAAPLPPVVPVNSPILCPTSGSEETGAGGGGLRRWDGCSQPWRHRSDSGSPPHQQAAQKAESGPRTEQLKSGL